MIKLLILLLFPVLSFGQFTIERIAYDSGPGGNDTLWTRDGSQKDTLFRRTAGVFNFGNKPYFRKLWTSVDIMDWNSLYGAKQNTLVSGTNIKTVNGNTLLGTGDVSISGAVAWGNVTGTLSSQTDLQSALDGKLGTTGNGSGLTGLTKTQVGLANADNTSDANKPVSSATQTALNLKANLASPTFTGTVAGITSTMVGLGNVTNESKSTMFSSPTFTGTVSGVTATHVGLGNVNNTSDANKPVSTAQQAALDLKLATNGSAAALTSFPTLNQNTTGTAAGLSAVLSFANGGISASAATSATTGTMTVNMTTSMITITPTGACTFNASGGVAGQVVTFLVTTSGTTSFVLTFGTNFRKVGTLATGTVSARFFSVTFICINGTTWQEVSRTAVQT